MQIEKNSQNVHFQKIYFYILIPVFAGIIFGILVYRLFLGVDLTDEAFYISLTKVFTQGFRPYLDEILVVQSFAILLAPMMKIYLFFVHDAEGLVLFFRLLFFTSLALFCWALFLTVRHRLQRAETILICLLFLSSWAFTIPSLSYNTLGSIFFNLGILILLFVSDQKSKTLRLVLALLFFTLSIFCYPTTLVSVAVALGLFIFCTRSVVWPRKVFICSILFLFLCFIVFYYLVFIHIGLERVVAIYNFTHSFSLQGGGYKKVMLIKSQFQDNFKFSALIIGGIWGMCWAARIHLFLGFLLLVFLATFISLYPIGVLTILPFHLVGLILVLTGLPDSFLALLKRKLDFWSMIPLIACTMGIIYSWTSSNGLPNFAAGATIGLLGFALFLSRRLESVKGGRYLSTTTLIFFVCVQVKCLFTYIYGDDSNFKNLTTQILSGPYKGLFTNPEKVKYLDLFAADITELKKYAKTIAFLESTTAGYLFTDIKISAPGVWVYSLNQLNYDRDFVFRFYQQEVHLPDILVWGHLIPVSHDFSYKLDHDLPDKMKSQILPLYHVIKERPEYTIYSKNNKI